MELSISAGIGLISAENLHKIAIKYIYLFSKYKLWQFSLDGIENICNIVGSTHKTKHL